jgi:hypothetical protein
LRAIEPSDNTSAERRHTVAEIDRRLRDAERAALAAHRARLADEASSGKSPASRTVEPPVPPEAWEGTVVRRLRQDIERLAQYQAAVEASRVWRAAQWARRAFGRKW